MSYPNSDQRTIAGRAFSYDVSQGGKTFTDPDGDSLYYSLRWDTVSGAPPAWISVNGTTISGVPTEAGYVEVTVSADDGRNGWNENRFALRVVENSAPERVNHNPVQIVAIGEAVNYDATQAGSLFMDADGDTVSYRVSIVTTPHGLSVSGVHVTGAMNAVAAVQVKVAADDGFGGVSDYVFMFAAPGPEPGAPTLPATSYTYADEALALPFIFRISSESRIPLWDTQPDDNRTSDAGATLGRVLFYDRRLSVTNTHSCASCHQQSTGFTVPDRFSVGVLGIPMKRSTMALANVRYNIQHAWFSDMRVESLEELALQPIQAAEELGNSLELTQARLRGTSFYPGLFQAAFGSPEITSERMAKALAQFLRSLISYQAKIDSAYNPMTNDPPDPTTVLNGQEMRGFDIFKGAAGVSCFLCHDVNAQANIWQANNGLDEDSQDVGTLNLALRRGGSLGVFRPASLRNIAVTSPYMHDGRFATLREVIDHYDHGIKDSPNLDPILRDSNGDIAHMDLSDADKDALEAFLHTFTDNAFLTDPKFSDPFL